jgi:hypothetical protein
VARLMRGVTQTDLSRLRASLGRLNRALEGP